MIFMKKNYMKHLYLGIYEMTYPRGDEDIETSRLADKKSISRIK